MPHLIFLGLIGAVGFFGYRAFVREAERVTKATRKAQAKREGRPTEKLVLDPKTGKYRPADED